MKQKRNVMRISDKRTAIIAASVIAILSVAYFSALPQVQADNYISAVKTKQATLHSEFDKLKGLLELDIFTKPSQPSKVVYADVERSATVLTSVKNLLSANENTLTSFPEYPLLFLNPTFSNALNLKKLEETYIQNIKSAMTEMEAVLAYFDASADIAAKVETGSEGISATAKLKTAKQMIAAFEPAIESMQYGADEYSKLTPPASLRQYHDVVLQYNEGLIRLFEQFVAALKSKDPTKIKLLSPQITALTGSGSSQAAALLDNLIDTSTLRGHIDAATDADKKITEILGKS